MHGYVPRGDHKEANHVPLKSQLHSITPLLSKHSCTSLLVFGERFMYIPSLNQYNMFDTYGLMNDNISEYIILSKYVMFGLLF